MPRGPHDMGAQQDSCVEQRINIRTSDSPDPQGDSPFGAMIILRLDSAQVPHHLSNTTERLAHQMLVIETLPGNVGMCYHECSIRYTCRSARRSCNGGRASDE